MIETVLLPVLRELGLGIFIRATVVMAVAAIMIYKFRQSSASVRYAIWGAAFVMLIILPIVSHTVPPWRVIQINGPAVTVPVHSGRGTAEGSFSGTGSAKTEIDGKALSPGEGSGNSGDEATAGPGRTSRIEDSGQGMHVANTTPIITDRRGQKDIRRMAGSVSIVALFSIWFLVAAVLMSRFLVQLLTVNGITSRAVEVNGDGIASTFEGLLVDLSIRRRVRVLLSEEISMPFAWGIIRPAIILPIDAGEWQANRLRSVMIHELAHVARWDYLIHVIMECVRVMYWPNPIVWMAARKGAMERERACDDFALRFGTASVDYASDLLHIARMQVEGGMLISTVSMAGEPGLTERIDHVMNGAINRSPLRKGILAVTTAVIMLLVIPIGSVAIKTNRWVIPDTRGLVERLREGEDPAERSMAAWWLGEHEDRKAVFPLMDALKDESRIVRVSAAWALGEIKDRDSIDGLIEMLETDEELLAREMAALALGEIEHPSAIEALEEAYEADERLALAVVWALGEIGQRGSRKAYNLREEIIEDLGLRYWDNEQVWTGSLSRRLPRSRDLEKFLAGLEKRQDDERREAAFGIGAIGIKQEFEDFDDVKRAVRALILTLEDPAPEVRAMAVWSLDEINPSRKRKSFGLGH